VFDISFSELFVIGVVALLVIGPEKLPKVARTAGVFAGRLQKFVAQVKEEVSREARFEELQKLQQEVKDSVGKFESGVRGEISKVKSSVDEVANEIADAPVKKATRQTRKPNPSATKSDVAKVSATKRKVATTKKARTVKKAVDEV
jgi:sec-independent protein translocase protein TatB